jgi:hypothetical protein
MTNNKSNGNNAVKTAQGGVNVGNQQAVTQQVVAIKQTAGVGNNEHDVTIVEKIVEGSVQKSGNESTAATEIAKIESEKAMKIAELESEKVTEIAESEKEKAIEVVKLEAEAKVKLAELDNEKTLKIAEMEDSTKTQIAEWEHEAKMKLLGINERIDYRKAELDAKVKMTQNITDAVKWVTGAAAVAAVMIVNTGATKEVQLEKIKQGLID